MSQYGNPNTASGFAVSAPRDVPIEQLPDMGHRESAQRLENIHAELHKRLDHLMERLDRLERLVHRLVEIHQP